MAARHVIRDLEETTHRVTITLPIEVYERIRRIARDRDMSVTALMREWLSNYGGNE
jgi:predicted DNA-binding ribbon-helix-helix protein